MTSVAHASLMCHLRYKDDSEYQSWLKSSFKKVICKVSEKEFEKAKTYEDFLLVSESRLDNKEIALVFKPRKEFPKAFKYYKLYK